MAFALGLYEEVGARDGPRREQLLERGAHALLFVMPLLVRCVQRAEPSTAAKSFCGAVGVRFAAQMTPQNE